MSKSVALIAMKWALIEVDDGFEGDM